MKPLALVVENDAGTRKLLEAVLSRAGFQVDTVNNGESAVALCSEIDYSMVVLDLLLPFVSGFDLLEWMQRERPAMLQRVLVLSSLSMATLEEVRERCAVRVMRKPFELQELIRILGETEVVIPRERGITTYFCRASVAMGAKTGVLVRGRGTELELLAQFGYASSELEPCLPMTTDDPYPICDAFTRCTTVWLPSLHVAAAEYPMLVPLWERTRTRAVAAVPLLRDGAVIGAAGWTFRDVLGRNDEQRQIQAIAARTAEMIAPASAEPMRRARA
jgi:CheY-like chemotaxis protein